MREDRVLLVMLSSGETRRVIQRADGTLAWNYTMRLDTDDAATVGWHNEWEKLWEKKGPTPVRDEGR